MAKFANTLLFLALKREELWRSSGVPDEHGSGVVWGEFYTAVEYRQ